MQLAIQKVTIDVVGQQSEGSNADAILDQHHCQAGEHKNRLFPKRAKGEMSYQECQDKQSDAGTDPTAFLGNFNAHRRQVKVESLSQHWNATEIKQ